MPEKNASDEEVRLRLYDVLGRQVQSVRTSAGAGGHETQLSVEGLASGTYFLRRAAGGQTETRRVTVVR